MSEPAKYDDLNTSAILVAGVISAVMTFVLVVVFQAIYYYGEASIEARKANPTGPTKSQTILAEQRGKLSNYAWVDRNANIVSIPIDQAMALVLREQNAQPEAPTDAAAR